MSETGLKPCPFCGGGVKYENYPWWDGKPCYSIEHVDFKAAVKAKCPLEMGGYDTPEELAEHWNRRERE